MGDKDVSKSSEVKIESRGFLPSRFHSLDASLCWLAAGADRIHLARERIAEGDVCESKRRGM